MEQNTNGSNDPTRLERIVEVLANVQSDMQRDLKIVLGAQVVMGETITNMGEAITKLTAEVRIGLAELAKAQKHTDQRMDALILVVDEIIRGRKTQ